MSKYEGKHKTFVVDGCNLLKAFRVVPHTMDDVHVGLEFTTDPFDEEVGTREVWLNDEEATNLAHYLLKRVHKGQKETPIA